MPRPTHPTGEIMDYLHMQLCMRKMNEEHLAEGRIWEVLSFGVGNKNKRVCVEESEKDVVFRGDSEGAKTVFYPYQFQLSVCSNCASVPPGQAWGKCCPPAALCSHRLSQSLHLQSNSIKSRPAANKPWQILSFGIHFGTAVVPSKRGDGEGGSQQSVMYAECLHVLDDSDTSACHRRHQFYLVTALRGNPYDCSAVRTLLIVIYLSGVIMLSRGWQRNIMEEVPNEGWKQGLWSIFCAAWPVTTEETSLQLLSHSAPLSLLSWAAGARPSIYVIGIITICHGAGGERENGWKRSRESGSRGRTESEQKRWWREARTRMRKLGGGRLPLNMKSGIGRG